MSRIRMTVLTALALLTLPLFGGQASAQYWANKNGSDANDCISQATPCRTIQGAVRKVPMGVYVWLQIENGTWDMGVNFDPQISIVYYRFISIFGDCTDRGNVVLRQNDASTPIISAQDHPIVALNCLTLTAAPNVTGVTGLYTRQYAIGDCSRVRFGAMPGGTHLISNEVSKINCGDIEISGGASAFAHAGAQSNVTAAGALNVTSPITYTDTIASVSWLALMDLTGLSISGSAITGKAYSVQNGVLLRPPGGIPGTLPGDISDGGIVK